MTSPLAGPLIHATTRPHLDRSKEAARFFDDLMSLEPDVRRTIYRPVMADQRFFGLVLGHARATTGTEYGLWTDDPVGFVEDVLHETTWSKQRKVLVSVGKHKRTAVPSAVGTGKTHISARAVLWRSLAYPIGTSLSVTTATRFRQVQRQMWPHIRKLVKRAGLPLVCDQTQLRGYTRDGVLVDVAYGFTAPAHDEAGMQGIHAPRIFVVVDEAGGLSPRIGKSIRGILTGADSRALFIGNPPTDEEGGWFEGVCNEDDVSVITISAMDAPKLTGEKTLRCLDCPPEMPRHPLGDHIVDDEWVAGTIKDYGEDSPFVQAKVFAKFPRGGASRTIPYDWVEMAAEAQEPTLDEKKPGCGLCAKGEHQHYGYVEDFAPGDRDAGHVIARGAWVRLGIDVAADGGDEFVIARTVGDLATVRHTSRGPENSNPQDVAGKCLEEIRSACALAEALGSTRPVKVKIDALGIGWAVAGLLQAWVSEHMLNAEVVAVKVSENTYRDPDGDKATLQPYRKRDEMWLTGRDLLRPREVSPGNPLRVSLIRLRVNNRCQRQLAAPKYGTSSSGHTVIESKDNMKKRGQNSPDQAEAVLLAWYEPILAPPKKGTDFKVLV